MSGRGSSLGIRKRWPREPSTCPVCVSVKLYEIEDQ